MAREKANLEEKRIGDYRRRVISGEKWKNVALQPEG